MATKKTAAKKATPKAETPKAAGASMLNYQIDAGATSKMTQGKNLFFKFPVGNTPLRFLPQFNGDPAIFTKSVLHYTVKSDDMQRNIAPACLREHGDGNCYICNWIEWLKETGDPVLANLGDELWANPNGALNIQAFVQDVATKAWNGPFIVGISPKLGKEMSTLLNMAKDNDVPPFCHPELGETMIVNRVGTGKFDTKYQLMQTGKRGHIKDLIPDWETKVIRDLWKKLDVKVLSPDEQKKALHRTYPDLPWQEIQKAIG